MTIRQRNKNTQFKISFNFEKKMFSKTRKPSAIYSNQNLGGFFLHRTSVRPANVQATYTTRKTTVRDKIKKKLSMRILICCFVP